MIRHNSTLKAVRQSKKKYFYNQKIKQGINYLERKFKKALLLKNKEEAKNYYLKLQKSLDKAWQKGILKKNTAGRKKSRLAKKLNHFLKQTKG